MYKVTSKITVDVLLEGGGWFIKNVAVTFSLPKLIYEWPHKKIKCTFVTKYLHNLSSMCQIVNESKMILVNRV